MITLYDLYKRANILWEESVKATTKKIIIDNEEMFIKEANKGSESYISSFDVLGIEPFTMNQRVIIVYVDCSLGVLSITYVHNEKIIIKWFKDKKERENYHDADFEIAF